MKSKSYNLGTNLKKNNWKLFSLIFLTLSILLIYSITRTFWLANTGVEVYSMAASWTYLQILGETLAIFIIGPTVYFLANTKDNQQKINKLSLSLIFGLIIAIIYLILVMSMSPYIVAEMTELNVGSSAFELYSYLLISSFGIIFKIFINILLANILIDEDYRTIIFAAIFQLFIYISVDFILISEHAVTTTDLFIISITNVLSPILFFIFISIFTILKYKDEIRNIKIRDEFKSKETKLFMKAGLILVSESLIRNLFYIFITLEIASGITQNEWAAWNASMYILFGIYSIFLTSITATSLNMYANNKEEKYDVFKSIFILTILCGVIILILMPIMATYFINWNLQGLNNDVINLATTTHYQLAPFYVLLMLSSSFSIYFIISGKAWKYLLTTILVGIIFNAPMSILIYTNVLPYTYPVTIWSFNLGILFSFLIGGFLMIDERKPFLYKLRLV